MAYVKDEITSKWSHDMRDAPFGAIMLGHDERTYGKNGIDWVKYDPEYECGGDALDGQCPHIAKKSESLLPPERKKRLINVAIASYRDPLCPVTLFNMFTKAKNPSDIRVYVLQQNDPEVDVNCLDKYCEMMQEKALKADDPCPFAENVNIHHIHAKDAYGPAYARGLISADLSNAHDEGKLIPQDYCLSMDSHMDFEPEFDAKLIDMWNLSKNEYAVLSTYVASTEQLGVNLNGINEVPHLCMVVFTSSVRVHATKCARGLTKPKLTNAVWGAGLSFSKCHAELKVPVDIHTPHIFDGEEFNRAARFWTHGYDIYTPHRVYVLHNYKDSQSRAGHSGWMSNKDTTSSTDSSVRLNSLIDVRTFSDNMKVEEVKRFKRSRYGLGDRRSLDQLIDFSGIDLRHRRVSIDGKNRCGNIQWVPFEEHPKGVNFIPKFDANEDPIDFPDVTSVWYEKSLVKIEVKKTAKPSVSNVLVQNNQKDPTEIAVVHEPVVVSSAQKHGVLHAGKGYNAESILGKNLRVDSRILMEPARLLGRQHGITHLPLFVQFFSFLLVVGVISSVVITRGTGRGARRKKNLIARNGNEKLI